MAWPVAWLLCLKGKVNISDPSFAICELLRQRGESQQAEIASKLGTHLTCALLAQL